MKNLCVLTEDCGIYKIVNTINNKTYIGQSKNIKKRILYHHICDYNNLNNCCYESKFYRAIRKYGLDVFQVETLELCEPQSLDEKEKKWIEKYDSFKNGYNSTEGGQSWSENVHSPETQLRRLTTLEKTKALQDENHPRAKLSNEEVIKIRQRYIDGETCENIHKDYQDKYVIGSFKKIIFGTSYKRVGNVPSKEERRHTNGKFTANQVRSIRERYKNEKITQAKLAEEFGISGSTIASIISGKTYKNIK